MTDLLDRAVAAHGGLDRFNHFKTVSAHLVTGGALQSLKGQVCMTELWQMSGLALGRAIARREVSAAHDDHSSPGRCDLRPALREKRLKRK